MQAFKKQTVTHRNGRNQQDMSAEERNRIIEQYLPLIRKIAGYVIRNHAHQLDYGDLVNVGVFGLIQAIKNFDHNYDVNFAGYCKTRIRGAMFDELRRLDWIPRHTRHRIKEVEKVKQEFHLRLNRSPNPTELADELGISLDDLNTRNVITTPPKMFSLNQMVNDESEDSTFTDFLADRNSQTSQEAEEKKDSFGEFIKGLTKTEQLILILYYQEDLNMHQTGLLLGISESRVCQIHSRIIQRLRTKYHHLGSMFKSA